MKASLVFALAAAALLSACSAVSALSGSPSVTLQRDVYSAENDFAAVLPVAVAYENLPRCGTAAAQGQVCAQSSIVAKVTAAANAAQASLKTAVAAARAPNNLSALTAAALQARGDVTAFRTLVGSVQQ